MAKFSFEISTKLQLQSDDQSLLQKFDRTSASKCQSIKILTSLVWSRLIWSVKIF